jgi:hypothetical protein
VEGAWSHEKRTLIQPPQQKRSFLSLKEASDLVTTRRTAQGWHSQVGTYVIIPGLDFLRVKLYYKYTRAKAT